MNDVLAHLLEDRLGFRERGITATDHESERPRGSTADATRHRGIDHLKAGLGGQRCNVTRAVDVDGRAVDQQNALADIRQYVLLVDFAHMLAGRQHRDDDLGALDRFGGGSCLVGPLLDRRGDGRIGQVEGCDVVLGLGEVRGHRAAHVTKTNKGDFRHDFLPDAPGQSKNRSFETGLKCDSTISRVTPSMVGGFHCGF